MCRLAPKPTKSDLESWMKQKYGDDFEPKFLENIIKQYLNTIDEHNEYSKRRSIKYISQNIFKLDRIYRKQETQYWITRGWDSDTSEKKRVVRDKNWYISTYGEVEGLKKLREKNKRISENSGHSLDKYIKKYGDERGRVEWDIYRSKCVRNQDFFIGKYGEELGKIKYSEFKEKSMLAGYTFEYCVNKYGYHEGTEKYQNYLSKIKPNIHNFIRKYGEELGVEKHKQFKESSTVRIGKASKESLLVFKPLMLWLEQLIDISNIYIGYGKNKEYFINNGVNIYLYDFTIRNLKIIIEFNGVTFHANPEWDDTKLLEWSNPFNKEQTSQQNISNFDDKIKTAESNGFKVLTIWSDLDVDTNLEKCKEFILNNL
jgi:very-short-patch-repair endonuclease